MNEASLKTGIKLELEKAEESLKGAQLLLNSELFDEAVSSAYYAMFHMAKALLLTVNEEPSTHQGLITLFGLKFVKPKIIEEVYNDMLVDAKESREAGDYDAARKFTREEAAEKVDNAVKFKTHISGYLEDKGYYLIIHRPLFRSDPGELPEGGRDDRDARSHSPVYERKFYLTHASL